MQRMLVVMLALFLVAAPAFADAADAGKKLSVQTFQFKHKPAEKAAAAIKSLLSADGSLAMQATPNALVITDSPENLKKIAAALAEFDQPAQAFRLSIRLVSAGRGAANEAPRVPAELRDIAPKLQLLRYTQLENAGQAEVLGKEGETGLVTLGSYRADFRFGEYDQASDSIKVSDFNLLRAADDTLTPMLKTTLNLKLGQTVIIGATRQPNARALMIVVTAKR
ncbi:MAG TPA: secretin N-terminal domain-containing protein [Thermoanaerobaculia bacterium]